jgi:hypothetical protein
VRGIIGVDKGPAASVVVLGSSSHTFTDDRSIGKTFRVEIGTIDDQQRLRQGLLPLVDALIASGGVSDDETKLVGVNAGK